MFPAPHSSPPPFNKAQPELQHQPELLSHSNQFRAHQSQTTTPSPHSPILDPPLNPSPLYHHSFSNSSRSSFQPLLPPTLSASSPRHLNHQPSSRHLTPAADLPTHFTILPPHHEQSPPLRTGPKLQTAPRRTMTGTSAPHCRKRVCHPQPQSWSRRARLASCSRSRAGAPRTMCLMSWPNSPTRPPARSRSLCSRWPSPRYLVPVVLSSSQSSSLLSLWTLLR